MTDFDIVDNIVMIAPNRLHQSKATRFHPGGRLTFFHPRSPAAIQLWNRHHSSGLGTVSHISIPSFHLRHERTAPGKFKLVYLDE